MKGIVFPSASSAEAGRTFASGRPHAFAMPPISASNSKTTSPVSLITPFAPKIGLGTFCHPVSSYDKTWIIRDATNPLWKRDACGQSYNLPGTIREERLSLGLVSRKCLEIQGAQAGVSGGFLAECPFSEKVWSR
jgi:hypothetical protein